MKTNHKIFLVAAAFLLFGTTACNDKLDIEQKGSENMENFYKTAADCDEAVTAMYAQLKTYVSGESTPYFFNTLLSDDCYSGASARFASDDKESFNEYRFDANNTMVLHAWQAIYNTIYRCNLIINNYDGSSDSSVQRAVAEAKVIRAFCNFNLVTLWGNAPLVTEAVRDDYKVPNNTPAELWAQVEKDLQEAIATNALPVKSDVNDKATGVRVTNDFAKCLLGKTYVFESSPNGGTGVDKWADAARLFDEVIGSGRYAMIDGYNDYCLASNNNNSEIIFSDNKLDNSTNEGNFTHILYGWSSNAFQGLGIGNECNFLGFGFMNPSASLVEAFKEEEGDNGYRFHETMKSYDDMLAMGVSLKDNVTCYGSCGYGLWKIRMSNKNLLSGSIVSDWTNDIVMRLGEVILLDAEAHIMLGDGQGDKYINMIRDHAHLPHLSGATLDDLKKEKRLEMCFEGTRFQDLIRWGDAANVLANQWKQVPNFAGKASDGSYRLEYPTVNQNSTYGFKKGKNELLPIPQDELNVNPNIKQNPGWSN